MQTDVYIKIINEKMNIKFWMAGFLVISKVYAVIASPFNKSAPSFFDFLMLHVQKQVFRWFFGLNENKKIWFRN